MADDATIFRALVEVVDKATAPLKGIGNVIKAMAGIEHEAHKEGAEGAAQHAHAVKALAGVEHEAHKHGIEGAHEHAHAFEALTTHVRLLRGHMVSLNGTVGELGSSMSEFLPMLAGIGAAGSLVGLFEIAEHASETFSLLNKSAMEAGVTAQQFSELAMAAKMTDVPVETMSTGLFRLNRVIADSVAGKNKDAAALFHHLGISTRDAGGHLRNASELMPLLADAFQHTTDPAMRARMAMALFGRAGMELLPLLDQGREKLDEYAQASRDVDFVPKGDEAEQLEEFHRGWVTLTAAVSGFTMEIGTKLAPVLNPLIDMVKEWIVANRDWVATDIAGAVGELSSWLQSLNLHEIVEGTKEWMHAIHEVVEELGGWHLAIGAVVLLLGSPILGAIAGVVEGIEALSGVLKGISLLLWANPILAAIGLVLVAGYELYEHWDWVKKELAAVFTWFTSQDATFQVLAGAVLPFIVIPAEIIAHWTPIKAFFVGLWGDITAIFDAAWGKLKPIVDAIGGAVHTITNSAVGRALGLDDKSRSPDAQAERAENLRAVRTGHAGPRLPVPPGPYEPGSASAAAAAASGAPGAPGASGQVNVKLDISGAPPGSKVQATSSGSASLAETKVGYADPLAYAF